MNTNRTGRPKVFNEDDIIKLVTEPMTTTYWFSLAKSKFGIARATFFLILARLRQSGRIQKPHNSHLWKIPLVKLIDS